MLTREVSGGKRVAGEQLRFGGGEGAACLTQGGQQQLGQEGMQGLGGICDSLRQVLFRLRGGLGVKQGQESLIGASPAAGNQHKGCNEREKFTVVARTVSAESVSNNACQHAGGNVLKDELVVGVAAGPVCGVGQVGFVQVPQHGFEGRGRVRLKVGAALRNPAVHGRLISDAGSLCELGARKAVGCNECGEVIARTVGAVGGPVVGGGEGSGEGGCHGGSFAEVRGELGCMVCDAGCRLRGWDVFFLRIF